MSLTAWHRGDPIVTASQPSSWVSQALKEHLRKHCHPPGERPGWPGYGWSRLLLICGPCLANKGPAVCLAKTAALTGHEPKKGTSAVAEALPHSHPHPRPAWIPRYRPAARGTGTKVTSCNRPGKCLSRPPNQPLRCKYYGTYFMDKS